MPLAFAALLLVLATWWDGAFALRHWGPAALFALVVLAALVASGGAVPVGRPLQLALAGIWGYAGWSLLSATWAHSAALAWEGANRTLLYAALVTLALVTTRRRRDLRLVGSATVAAIALIGVVTLVRLHLDGLELLLAGRLDSPVGYRNATAVLFAFVFWPLVCAAAERERQRALRGAAFGLATLALGLAFMTQSRGVAIGLAAGGAIALGLGPDRVRRTWLALLAIAGVAAFSSGLLAPFHAFDGGRGAPTADDVQTAATALTVLAALATLAGVLLAVLDRGLRAASSGMRAARSLARGALALGAVAFAAVALAAVGNPVEFAGDKLDEFSRLETSRTAATRLGSVEGQRYDLWRVAWEQFESAPIGGVGEGNYAAGYYERRTTDRNLREPHSLPLRTLAETGVVGAALLALFLAGFALAFARGWRRAEPATRRVAAGLAAAGAVVLGQSLVDWLWLIPGLMGLSLFTLALAAALVAPPVARAPGGARPGARRLLRPALALALAAGAASVLLVFVGDAYVREARSHADAERRLDAARTAERFNPLSVTPRYLQAGALETLGRRDEARAELRDALELEPRNFVTLGLLGDLELRAGDERRARALYRRALELNPRDEGLRRLATGRARSG